MLSRLRLLKRWKVGTGHVQGKYGDKVMFLKRWGIVTPLFQVWLHQILPNEQHYHNHILNFISIPLNGGYEEVILRDYKPIKRDVKQFNVNHVKKTDFHRVFVTKPTWTLAIFYGWKWIPVEVIIKGKVRPSHKWINPYI